MCNTVRMSKEEWISSLSRPEWLNTTDYERGLLVLVTMWMHHAGSRIIRDIFGTETNFSFLKISTHTSIEQVSTEAVLNIGNGRIYTHYCNDPMFMSETKTRRIACAAVAYDFAKTAFSTSMTPKMFHVFCEYVECDTYDYLHNGDFVRFGAEVAEAWELLGDIDASYSSGIHDLTTCGYGCIDFNGFWMFSLPDQEPSISEEPIA